MLLVAATSLAATRGAESRFCMEPLPVSCDNR